MADVLKIWKTIGATVAALGLAACSTPPHSSYDSTPPPPPPPPATPAVIATHALVPAGLILEPDIPVLAVPAPVLGPSANMPETPPALPGFGQSRQDQRWLAWESWAQQNGWAKPERLRHMASLTYGSHVSDGRLEVTAGNRTALWNGVNLELGFVPRLTNGEPYVHALDLAKTLAPLTMKPALLERQGRIIVIDPGHGGSNLGAKSVVSGRYEKELALDWALRLERLLKERNWTVHLTRTNDVELALSDRVDFADKMQADLFISLHFNSTDQPQGLSDSGGLETYCLTPVGMPSTLTRRFEDEENRVFVNNSFDAENYYFAVRLHRAMVDATGRKDRGVRRARFMGVLRGQNRPAVLLEGGYLSHHVEARLIGTADYRQKLAEALAKALSE